MHTAHSALSEPIAAVLRALAEDARGWRGFHDHAGAERKRLWAHLDQEARAGNILSGVDVLLASEPKREALLVLEIEETSCPPKTLLGDILSLALSGFITHARTVEEARLWDVNIVTFPAYLDTDAQVRDLLEASNTPKKLREAIEAEQRQRQINLIKLTL